MDSSSFLAYWSHTWETHMLMPQDQRFSKPWDFQPSCSFYIPLLPPSLFSPTFVNLPPPLPLPFHSRYLQYLQFGMCRWWTQMPSREWQESGIPPVLPALWAHGLCSLTASVSRQWCLFLWPGARKASSEPGPQEPGPQELIAVCS